MPINLSSHGLTDVEIEKVRLALSSFQDGTGWEKRKVRKKGGTDAKTYAGYRQFERLIAEIFLGTAREDKGVFDVLLQTPGSKDEYFGVSCKMKDALPKAEKENGQIYIELSNAAGGFTDQVKNVIGSDFENHPIEVGKVLIETVESWYKNSPQSYKLIINLEESSHLVLLYDHNMNMRLYQYPLIFPKVSSLTWEFPPPVNKKSKESRRLVGRADDKIVFEWYLHSGGQLKYYPFTRDAHWISDVFRMEPLPENITPGIIYRARQYFPGLWKDSQS